MCASTVSLGNGNVVEVSTVAIAILKDLSGIVLDYFDIVVAGGSMIAGAMGLVAVLDRDGIFNYTDRAMIKIGAVFASFPPLFSFLSLAYFCL